MLSEIYHIPVLLNETIEALSIFPGGKYIDATLGGGGHSAEIIARGGILLGIDRDPDAISYAGERLSKIKKFEGQFTLVNREFSKIDEIAKENGFPEVDGILFDLGVSSHQLNEASRGFSFNQGGKLDMRMNPELSVSAADLVNGLNEGELYQLFTRFGEDRFSKSIAKAIVRTRQIKKIEDCDELSNLILKTVPARGKFDRTHPATRIFQALRIAVNDELNEIIDALPRTLNILKKNGILVVLSFHSLEDRIVKDFFKEKEREGQLFLINKKPIGPRLAEVEQNPRARSAKLRAARKII